MPAGSSGSACGMEVYLKNTKFLCVSRFPLLNNRAIISVIFNKLGKSNNIMICGIFKKKK
jgi:hypothetical protein